MSDNGDDYDGTPFDRYRDAQTARPITDAIRRRLAERVPDDPWGRTYRDLLDEARAARAARARRPDSATDNEPDL